MIKNVLFSSIFILFFIYLMKINRLVPKEVAAQELVQQIPILQRYSQDIARIPFMNEPEKRDPYGWAKKE